MASQVVKLFLRLKPSKSDMNFSIDHTSFKFGSDTFVYHGIFSSDASQNDVYESIGKPLVENVMRGSNGVFLSYGATGSGKTYSLLGGQKLNGMIAKVLEELFLRAKVLKSKKTIVVVLSCFEIDGNRIRDLAKVLSDGKTRLDDESLEVREHQGNVYVDNLSVTQIDGLDQAFEMIEEGRRQRKRMEGNAVSQSLVHTVIKITVSQRELNINKAGTLTFVDLADSDASLENIGKTLETLRSLIVDLQQGHHASSDESTLTKILASNLKNNCLTSMLFHIDPAQSGQSLATLKFSNNCYSHIGANTPETILFKSHQQSDRIKKIQEEILDLKHKIEKTQEMHEGKLRGFGDIIGFNLDVESVIHAYPGSKERKALETHLNSLETLSEVENRNRRLEAKLEKNLRIFNEINQFELKNRAKSQKKIKGIEDQIRDIKIEIIELNERIQENVRRQVMTRTDELHRVLLTNHMELEEKAAVIHNLPFTLQSIASDMRAAVDYKEMGRSELEHQLAKQFQVAEDLHNKVAGKIRADMESNVKMLDQEARRFELECNNYIREKNNKVKKIENELIGCYEVFLDQDKLIKDIETGAFNNGIKPIYLSVHEIPKNPQREKFPYLFKALRKNGVLTSQKDNNFIKISNNLFTKKYKNTTKRQSSPVKTNFNMSFPETVKAATIKDEIPLEDITEKTFALREKAAKLQKAVLEQAKSLKTSRLSFNTVALQHQDLELELKKSQTERDKQKDLYTSLMKAKIDTKIVIDSQKRIMDKYTFITEQLNSRPSTGKPRPLTGKQRPFTASNVRGGLFSSQHIIS